MTYRRHEPRPEPASSGPIPMPLWTDQQLIAQLKWELTEGYKRSVDGYVVEATKPWRNRLWKIAQEFDRRISPKPGAHRK